MNLLNIIRQKNLYKQKIEVCINQPDEKNKSKNKEKELIINIVEIKSCPYGNSSNDKNHTHLKDINDFINLIWTENKIKICDKKFNNKRGK